MGRPIFREADNVYFLEKEESIGLVGLFFFQKKKQKALFRSAEGSSHGKASSRGLAFP
jgi:hypothetical protein